MTKTCCVWHIYLSYELQLSLGKHVLQVLEALQKNKLVNRDDNRASADTKCHGASVLQLPTCLFLKNPSHLSAA